MCFLNFKEVRKQLHFRVYNLELIDDIHLENWRRNQLNLLFRVFKQLVTLVDRPKSLSMRLSSLSFASILLPLFSLLRRVRILRLLQLEFTLRPRLQLLRLGLPVAFTRLVVIFCGRDYPFNRLSLIGSQLTCHNWSPLLSETRRDVSLLGSPLLANEDLIARLLKNFQHRVCSVFWFGEIELATFPLT